VIKRRGMVIIRDNDLYYERISCLLDIESRLYA
jgi:hypothetical protein